MTSKTALLQGAALVAVFALGGGAIADAKPVHHKHMRTTKTVREERTETTYGGRSELGELRSEVQSLRATVEAQAQSQAALQAQLAQQQSQVAQVVSDNESVEARLDAVPQQVLTTVGELPKPKNDKIYYRGVSITLGGFAEAAGIYRSHDETADISSSFSKIPFPNDRAGHTSEFRGTGRQSRYSALIEGDINPDTTAYFYGEFDFQGGAQTANSNQSNSYNPRIRNLYAQLDHGPFSLLAGQNWSLVTMNQKGITPRNELTPPQIDAQYIPGFAWARQPQLRLTYSPDKKLWFAASLENPQTTFGSVAVATGVTVTNFQAPTNGFFNGTNYSLNKYPDVVGKVAYEAMLPGERAMHIEAFGLLRSFYDRVTVAPAAGTQAATLGLVAGTGDNTTMGGGFGGGVTLQAFPKILDLQVSALSGKGIARYGSAGLSDVTARADGKLEGVNETMFLAGGTWHALPILDIYAFGGEEQANQKIFHYAAIPTAAFGYGTLPGSNNTTCAVEGGACSAVTKYISQGTVGFWHKIYQGGFGRVQWGIQYSYTERKAFGDAQATPFAPKGDENMVFTSFRYYPF